MRFLPPSIPSARCLFRVQGVLRCVWILLHWTTASCSRACTLWLGRQVRDRGLSRCSHATPPRQGLTNGAHADRDPCDLLLVAPATTCGAGDRSPRNIVRIGFTSLSWIASQPPRVQVPGVSRRPAPAALILRHPATLRIATIAVTPHNVAS